MKLPLQLLLLEDSDVDAELLLTYLGRQDFQVEAARCDTQGEFLRLLEARSWDLVISDFHLSGFDGMAALKLLRERDADVPFILISGVLTEEAAVEAIRAGASDFVLKSNLTRLGRIVRRELKDRATRRRYREDQSELRLLQLAVQQMPDALVVTDPTGQILFANPGMEAVSGYTQEELLGQNVRLFKSGRHEAPFYRNLWDTVLGGHVWRGTFTNRRKDGGLWDNQAVIAPVLGGGDQPAYFVCTSRDVSQEHALQVRLEQAQRLEAIGVLTGGIAHDFNNILMPILGNAELGLARTQAQPRIQHHFEVILHSAQRASDLIHQILTFSRKGEGRAHPVDVASLLKESVKLMRATLPTSITIHCDLDRAEGCVRADPTQLHQIILNLCTNAAHAMGGQAGTLGITLDRSNAIEECPCVMGGHLPPGAYLRLTVSDTGCGIPNAVLDQIFLPFFTTKGPGEGTGLGLSILHGIVRGLGGGIQVESREGIGTVFRVLLPTTEELATESHLTVDDLVPSAARVLVVDDEAPILDLLDAGLRELGFQISPFQDSQAALVAFSGDPQAFDLVLTDLTMPLLTGLALIRELGQVRPGLPILLMTGSQDQIDPSVLQGSGVREVLHKPVTPGLVARAIQRALSADPA